eukprot:TRINITY_DN2569_c0_g1_i1.p1 TRINITY_DN2569_c0_g1~~TRINITY_DN2569_c0_g1_i1.p1  ORF type:complete len:196 (+),score=32.29 TRINITY_DN2569_c0_g1_i1:169-756(+)
MKIFALQFAIVIAIIFDEATAVVVDKSSSKTRQHKKDAPGDIENNPCYIRSLEEQPPAPMWRIDILVDGAHPDAKNGSKVADALAKEAESAFANIYRGKRETADTEYSAVAQYVHEFQPLNAQFADVLSWIVPRIGDLTGFFHPYTGCHKSDVQEYGVWIGVKRFTHKDLKSTSRWSMCSYPTCADNPELPGDLQ